MATQRAAQELADYHAEEGFHRREWRVQRIGWVLIFLIIAGACAGLLGHGPLARQSLAGSDGVIELERFVRRDAAAQWTIRPSSEYATHSDFVVHISSAFMARYKIAAIAPEPRSSALLGPDVVMKFDAVGAQGGIVFHVEPQKAGVSEGVVRLGNSAPVRLWQLVYP